jgi:hypothetical protein
LVSVQKILSFAAAGAAGGGPIEPSEGGFVCVAWPRPITPDYPNLFGIRSYSFRIRPLPLFGPFLPHMGGYIKARLIKKAESTLFVPVRFAKSIRESKCQQPA